MINNEENYNNFYFENDEHEDIRLKIDNIERLKKQSDNYKNSATLWGISAGIWALSALLNSTRIVTTDDPSFLLYVIVCLNSITSGLNLKLSIDNYNKKKEIDNNIEKEKKLI